VPARGREEDRQKGRETKRLRSVKYLGYTLFAICPGSFNGHGRLHIDTTKSRAVHVTHAQVERERGWVTVWGGSRARERGGHRYLRDSPNEKILSICYRFPCVCVCARARVCVTYTESYVYAYLYALYVCLSLCLLHTDQSLTCMPYLYALYVCLSLCLLHTDQSLTCMPYLYALYVCLSLCLLHTDQSLWCLRMVRI